MACVRDLGEDSRNHIQNVYSKIGVSTRAAAAVFAMQHGLVPWEIPYRHRYAAFSLWQPWIRTTEVARMSDERC